MRFNTEGVAGAIPWKETLSEQLAFSTYANEPDADSRRRCRSCIRALDVVRNGTHKAFTVISQFNKDLIMVLRSH